MAGKESSVKELYAALVRAVAPAAVEGNILSVSIANDEVRVEYVDRTQVSVFEPDPIRVATAKVK